MQFIQNILSFNQILTVSLLGWFVAQVLKTVINFILLGLKVKIKKIGEEED